jgi:hypothetical protein
LFHTNAGDRMPDQADENPVRNQPQRPDAAHIPDFLNGVTLDGGSPRVFRKMVD